MLKEVVVEAPINIALIKYWGKADEAEMLPCNDSISLTVESPQLKSITKVEVVDGDNEDSFTLNGQSHQLTYRIKRAISAVIIGNNL